MKTACPRSAWLATPLALLASAAVMADAAPPAYVAQSGDLMHLDNGVMIDGQDLETQDGYTSGFRLTAGFSPLRLPFLDLGAEVSYRESDEVPTRSGGQALILDTISLGGSLVAGLRFGQWGLYAKSGFAEWEGDPIVPNDTLALDTAGTTRVQGFGIRLQFNGLVSRVEYEEFNEPSMAHLNLVTASIHIPF
ncbi:hypothetical protein KG088_00880 [Halomonas sp. TRM85114]|uniref:hypothetical protein n=1 Tax=Halomonas jincaotanensis TaxID=2810616 RepID=UPI001BD335EA|nr:hypothetical protein [Halomonas jincaotanensis]MBS9402181.1 hypothetical protein [Halomonas jincaotanensis]